MLGLNDAPIDVALDALLPVLGDQLMRHVVEHVRALGCHRAVLVTGGILSIFPLHAATYAPLAGEPATAPNGYRYACDDVAFTYTPSGLSLVVARATAQRQAQSGPACRAFVAGNPQLTPPGMRWRRSGYLPFAEWEARSDMARSDPPFA